MNRWRELADANPDAPSAQKSFFDLMVAAEIENGAAAGSKADDDDLSTRSDPVSQALASIANPTR